jgi:uncharacterized Zn-binding protein involved in type VI secretion
MPFVAVVGTTLLGSGSGVIGTPPLTQLPTRPTINGVPVALVGDSVQFNYTDTRGSQILTITSALASLFVKSNNIPVALQGTLMSDSGVSIGVPPQIIVQAT